MAMMLMQQGSKGAMRDLDYINPRPKMPSSALPPEVRARLGLGGAKRRASSEPPDSVHDEVYTGAANAQPKVGQSGAGTDWVNPRGHAFVRKGSGKPMSERASRKAQLEKAGQGSYLQKLPPLLPKPTSGGGSRPPSQQDEGPSKSRALLKPRRAVSLSRAHSVDAAAVH